MFKTVSFNIFEEKLEDVVFQPGPVATRDDKIPANLSVEITSRQSREIIIKPLNDEGPDREKPSPDTTKDWR